MIYQSFLILLCHFYRTSLSIKGYAVFQDFAASILLQMKVILIALNLIQCLITYPVLGYESVVATLFKFENYRNFSLFFVRIISE